MDASGPLPNPVAPASVPSVARIRLLHAALCRLARERFGASLAGKFLLADALGRGGDGFVIAASVAGAASLTPESDPATIRYAIRNGVVDFAVTHPDEALRILKNEIRKQQPVCVCLEWEVPAALANLAERGAQPDVIAWTDPGDPVLRPFLERGAALLALPAMAAASSDGSPAERTVTERTEVEWSAPEPVATTLRRIDAVAAAAIPEDDWERQSWLAAAPRYLPRQLRSRRCIAMTPGECATFERALRQKIAEGDIGSGIELRIGNAAPFTL